ncbi:MAG: hypothetical protein ACLFPF_06415 [Halanaerobiales bacterium]
MLDNIYHLLILYLRARQHDENTIRIEVTPDDMGKLMEIPLTILRSLGFNNHWSQLTFILIYIFPL